MTKVTITTAVKLSETNLKKIKSAVEKKHGKSVVYETVVDPKVIGGVRLTIGSTQFDATLGHKFDQLKNQLLSISGE